MASGQPLDRSALGLVDVTPGMFAPMISAFLLRWLCRDRDVPRPLGLKRRWLDYLFAILIPVSAFLIAIPFYFLLGAESFTWAGEDPVGLVFSLVPLTLFAAITALGEEYGWRGYLLPLLLPHGRQKATLIVGMVWSLWHLPIVLSGLTYPGQPVLPALVVFVPSVLLLSYWFTELFTRSNGSVALAALTHGTLNALSEISSPRHFPGLNPMMANPFGVVVAVVSFILTLLISRSRKQGEALGRTTLDRGRV